MQTKKEPDAPTSDPFRMLCNGHSTTTTPDREPRTLGELKAASKQVFAHTAYQVDDGELVIIGKYCRCAYLGNDLWDVWLCNPSNTVLGLSAQRIAAIRHRICEITPLYGQFRELKGEGIYLAMPSEVFLLPPVYSVLGIRKRGKARGTPFTKCGTVTRPDYTLYLVRPLPRERRE